MSYSDCTLDKPVLASRRTKAGNKLPASFSAQVGVTLADGPVVVLRIETGGRRQTFEIPLYEWSRLNRDALAKP
jgi:hypothetical protein